jgi:hypothetical protein
VSERDRHFDVAPWYRCITCGHFGLCAPDCPIAPWNTEPDLAKAPSPFAYLLRQRRWSRFPVEREDTWFCNRDIRHRQQLHFFGYVI